MFRKETTVFSADGFVGENFDIPCKFTLTTKAYIAEAANEGFKVARSKVLVTDYSNGIVTLIAVGNKYKCKLADEDVLLLHEAEVSLE